MIYAQMHILKTIFNSFKLNKRCNTLRKLSSYQINIFPALKDNYMYLLTSNETKCCAAIDPVEPDNISHFINSNSLNLTHVLITHHHWDHSGGTNKLLSQFQKSLINVVGFDDRIEGLNYRVKHNDIFKVGNLDVQCLFTPCHTKGHMSYFIGDHDTDAALFSGDTLFVAGCGKFFEGTPSDMYNCIKTISKLPSYTKVYCGHEYTITNLEFALSIDPQNKKVAKKLKWAKDQRKQNLPTVPTTISEEIETNPYFQTNNEHYKVLTGQNDPITIIKVIREMKDRF